MPLREFLQKKDQINKGHGNYHSTTGLPSSTVNPVPEIRFVAPDPAPTTSNIPPSRPTYDDGIESDVDHQSASRYNRLNLGPSPDPSPQRKSLSLLHRSSRSRSPSESSTGAPQSESPPQSRPRRLSNLLHRGNSRSPSPVSAHIPADLPQIDDNGKGDAQHKEAQWEKRATVLVQNPPLGSPGLSPNSSYGREQGAPMRARSSSRGVVADRDGDLVQVNIQEAIRLHEIGELEASTKMFGKLADPNGVNNALSQVLYGLALRHGWGCTTDPEKAISYLSAAASNSASVESEALQAGIKKGGAAKGELVLAIFELANCFRNGWGVAKDPVAARQYFETAANLGDTDALNEAAWCYLEGFGGKKDKFLAAKYYRLAEEKGNKLVGNSWCVFNCPRNFQHDTWHDAGPD